MYQKLIREGEEIHDESAIDDLHDLRKTGKKLRYLIECFVTLYEKEKIARVLGTLTALQDVLGNLTDLDVQKNLLAKWADEMEKAHIGGEQSLQSIHTLEQILAKREEKKKSEFVACFAEFACSKNRKLFKKLFSTKAPE
jgi:CHAD domain-containing protein